MDGTHTISLKKAGYEEWKNTVTVKAWKTVLIKADRLKPAVMAKPPSQQPMIEINPPVAEQKTSDIHFTAGATDSLPVKPSGVSTGNQQITVKKDAYPDHDKTVAVQESKTTSATESLKPPSKYTKLDSNGKQLPDSAQSWLMVLDNETNLIWEVKQNKDGIKNYGNPNDADNTYLRFECDPKFIKVLNGANWGGFSDWRLPSEKELKTLVDFNGRKPTINTAYFPNTQSSFYRSSTIDNRDLSKLVDFGNGPDMSSTGRVGGGNSYGRGDYKDDGAYVRAVRGGQYVELSGVSTGNQQITVKKDDYLDRGETVAVQTGKTTSATESLKPASKYTKLDSNGKQLPDSAQSWLMVLDNETNLIWEVKQNRDGGKVYNNPNDADNMYLRFECDPKFIKVLNGANWGGFSDWRLPSEKELKTLVDFNGRPTINTAYFPNTQSSFYRSSTTDNRDLNKLVDFGNGPDVSSTGRAGGGNSYGRGDYKDDGAYVRAVRGGQ